MAMRHVLGSCHTCVSGIHIVGAQGYVITWYNKTLGTCYPACYMPLLGTGNIIHGRLWVVQDMTRWGKKTGQRADWEKANCSSTLLLTALTTTGTCSVRVCKAFVWVVISRSYGKALLTD